MTKKRLQEQIDSLEQRIIEVNYETQSRIGTLEQKVGAILDYLGLAGIYVPKVKAHYQLYKPKKNGTSRRKTN